MKKISILFLLVLVAGSSFGRVIVGGGMSFPVAQSVLTGLYQNGTSGYFYINDGLIQPSDEEKNDYIELKKLVAIVNNPAIEDIFKFHHILVFESENQYRVEAPNGCGVDFSLYQQCYGLGDCVYSVNIESELTCPDSAEPVEPEICFPF